MSDQDRTNSTGGAEFSFRSAEYKALRAEILSAMGSIRTLFIATLTLFGALAVFGWNHPQSDAFFLLALVVAGIGLTMVVLVVHIAVPGDYIRHHIERPLGIRGWQSHVSRGYGFIGLGAGLGMIVWLALIVYFARSA